MKFKTFLIMLFVMLCLVGITAVSAAENTSDVQSAVMQESSVDEDVLSVDSSEQIEVKKSDVSDNVEVKSADSLSKVPLTKSVEVKSKVSKSVVSTSDVKKATKKTSTKVDADDVAVVYKKNKYFKFEVETKYTDRDVKNIKVNLKVYTNSKSKTYSVYTNSYGVAKFNTNKLSLGNHKVIITSGDSKYSIYKKANIFVGKYHALNFKVNSPRNLKNNDTINIYKYYDEDDVNLRVGFKGTPKYTKIIKAKFYFKNKYTGRVIVKTDRSDFDDGRWEWPDEDYSYYNYVPVKVKVYFVSSRT